MVKFRIAAIAAGLSLAVSGPAFAAKPTSKHSSRTKDASHSAAYGGSANSGSAIRASGRSSYPNGAVPYNRNDPYAPGVNWPGHW